MKKLDSSFNPTSMERQTLINIDKEVKEVDKEVSRLYMAQREISGLSLRLLRS
jgi:hypothetical protein